MSLLDCCKNDDVSCEAESEEIKLFLLLFLGLFNDVEEEEELSGRYVKSLVELANDQKPFFDLEFFGNLDELVSGGGVFDFFVFFLSRSFFLFIIDDDKSIKKNYFHKIIVFLKLFTL